MKIQKLFEPILDFIFPPVCPACKERQETFVELCLLCQEQLKSKLEVQKHTDESDFTHLAGTRYFDHAITFWKYSDELDHLVQLVKYHGKKKLGRHIGELAGKALQQYGSVGADMIIPVPLHAKRRSRRGYNQSEWIARGFGAETGLSTCPEILMRTRHTRTQTNLDAEQRQENMCDAFTVPNPQKIKNKSVLVLDDVITTGATLNACARVLKENGVKQVIGIALARPLLICN